MLAILLYDECSPFFRFSSNTAATHPGHGSRTAGIPEAAAADPLPANAATAQQRPPHRRGGLHPLGPISLSFVLHLPLPIALRTPGPAPALGGLPPLESAPPPRPAACLPPPGLQPRPAMARGLLAVPPAPPAAAAAAEPPPPPDPTLSSALRRVMRAHWGPAAEFRPLQVEAVAATLAGRDALLILPTGGRRVLVGAASCRRLSRGCPPAMQRPCRAHAPVCLQAAARAWPFNWRRCTATKSRWAVRFAARPAAPGAAAVRGPVHERRWQAGPPSLPQAACHTQPPSPLLCPSLACGCRWWSRRCWRSQRIRWRRGADQISALVLPQRLGCTASTPGLRMQPSLLPLLLACGALVSGSPAQLRAAACCPPCCPPCLAPGDRLSGARHRGGVMEQRDAREC